MIIDFEEKYYPEIYSILKIAGLNDTDIHVLEYETKLLVNDELDGFYTAQKLDIFYNIHHFYVKKTKNVWELTNYAFKRAKELWCKWGLIHTPKGSRLDSWVKGLCRHRKLIQLQSPEEFNFYKVEI